MRGEEHAQSPPFPVTPTTRSVTLLRALVRYVSLLVSNSHCIHAYVHILIYQTYSWWVKCCTIQYFPEFVVCVCGSQILWINKKDYMSSYRYFIWCITFFFGSTCNISIFLYNICGTIILLRTFSSTFRLYFRIFSIDFLLLLYMSYYCWKYFKPHLI